MGNFGALELTYKERFVILYALNNLPSHDLKTAMMFRDLKGPLRFDGITRFDADETPPEGVKLEELTDVVVDFATAPQFLTVIPNAIRLFFTRFGYPPPVGQECLALLDRLDQMMSVENEQDLPVVGIEDVEFDDAPDDVENDVDEELDLASEIDA